MTQKTGEVTETLLKHKLDIRTKVLEQMRDKFLFFSSHHNDILSKTLITNNSHNDYKTNIQHLNTYN